MGLDGAFQLGSLFSYLCRRADSLLGHEALGSEWRLIQSMWLDGPGARLAGGTDEVMRNVIAERVLGLPGEIRTDKKIPFREL